MRLMETIVNKDIETRIDIDDEIYERYSDEFDRINEALDYSMVDFGFDLDEVADYCHIEIEGDDNHFDIRVCAELEYGEMSNMVTRLDRIALSMAADAYFEIVEPGIAVCRVWL